MSKARWSSVDKNLPVDPAMSDFKESQYDRVQVQENEVVSRSIIGRDVAVKDRTYNTMLMLLRVIETNLLIPESTEYECVVAGKFDFRAISSPLRIFL